MRRVERRNFLKVAAAVPFASPLRAFSEVASPLGKAVFVAAAADATGTEHHGPRAGTHLDFKVLTKDTQAGFFLIEHRNVPQGGPVRHLHYAQEEWFYPPSLLTERAANASAFTRARACECRSAGHTDRRPDGKSNRGAI